RRVSSCDSAASAIPASTRASSRELSAWSIATRLYVQKLSNDLFPASPPMAPFVSYAVEPDSWTNSPSRKAALDEKIRVMLVDDEALFNSIMAGAAGFVLKQIRGRDLIDTIRRVAAGQSLLDPSVTKRVLERLRKAKFDDRDPKLSRLSAQEERILDMVAEGL